MAQMRALENGRYMIRGTNNGVSAIIDQRGQIVARSEQYVETTLSGEVDVMLGNNTLWQFRCHPHDRRLRYYPVADGVDVPGVMAREDLVNRTS
jgi:hypothetical protein